MANEYLKRTPTSTGNRKTFTISFWKKHSQDGSSTLDFSAVGNTVNDNNNRSIFYWSNSNTFDYYHNVAGVVKLRRTEPATDSHRDFSSWYHVLVSTDTTKNESRIYLNGVEINYNSTATTDTINYETWYNSPYLHSIGSQFGTSFHNQTNYFDWFLVDGQALTPEVFGFYKDGNGYISAGSTQATDFRNGQWVPRNPREIKNLINDNGGFGVNGFYLPMNDSSNFGADFHTTPNSIITLKGENLPQPRNGAPDTTDAYVSQLRADPYAANLVLAVPGISTSTSANLVTNGTFDTNTSGWTSEASATLSSDNGRLKVLTTNTSYGSAIQVVTGLTIGQRYTFQVDMIYGDASLVSVIATTAYGGSVNQLSGWQSADYVWRTSFVADATSLKIDFQMASLSGVYGFWDNVILKAEDAPRDYSADIKGSGTNKTLTPNSAAGVGYEIPGYYGSAMSFPNGGSTGDDALKVTDNDLAMGTGDFTIEVWVNPDTLYNYKTIFTTRPDQSSYTDGFNMWINGAGATGVYSNGFLTQTANGTINTNQWTHVVAERYNGTLTTYVNGVAAAIQSSNTQNYTRTAASIGQLVSSNVEAFTGQMQDLRVYKGIAKYKGGFDVPKPYEPVGIESWRQVSDTCKNNFATLNSADAIENVTLTEGNLHWSAPNSGALQGGSCRSTINITSGKWYWEVQNTLAARYHIGLLATNAALPTGDAGLTTTNWVFRSDGYAVHNNSERVYGSDCDDTTGITVMVAFDSDTGKLYFGKNGTWFGNGNPALGTSEPAFSNIPVTGGVSPFLNRRSGANGAAINFGQNPSFGGRVTAGTYTDSNGKGLFKYQPPTGFLALCEDNLPTPAIKDPGDYFKTVLWTGDGNIGRSITGVGFQPDFVWIKSRSFTNNHHLFDVIRGPNNILRSSTTGAETNPGQVMSSFNSDGFTVGEDGGNNATNDAGNTFVAWCWKAGGAAVANTDGSIISQVSVNQTAGFSIVSYTGTGANATVGHGLAKTPYFVIVKKRTGVENWMVWHNSFADGDSFARLNTAGAEDSSSSVWNSTVPTDSVISIGTNSVVNESSSHTYIAYCWTEIEGYSKFASYTGNGNADGPFVYCGFRPAWVMVKRTDSTGGDWAILDSSRAPENTTELTALSPNDNRGQGLFAFNADYCSNGFKLRATDSFSNANGGTYAFFALAESPFQTANAK